MVSDGWIVCMWSVVSTLDLVHKDIINEAGEMRLYYQREGQEYYHITLPTKQSREWVIKKIFIPEQIVYAIPCEKFNSEFILPGGVATEIAAIQQANHRRLLWDSHHRAAESTLTESSNSLITLLNYEMKKATTTYPSISSVDSE